VPQEHPLCRALLQTVAVPGVGVPTTQQHVHDGPPQRHALNMSADALRI